MSKIISALSIIAFLTGLASCSPSKKQAGVTGQSPVLYQVIPDAEEKKILKGILTKELITEDTAFAWYKTNLQYFKADSTAVQDLRAKAAKVQIVIFGGTWCHDTQQILPKYLTILKAANVPDEHLTLVGVDRAKTTIGNLQKPFNITNVPTLILMQNGKETGRIVEYGISGLPDKELATLIKAVQ